MTSGAWVPPVDIYQNGDHELVLKAELPDMTREDIDITVEKSTLTIKGEKKFSSEVKEEQFHRIERRYGTFSRSFSLPQTVDATKVSAEYRNGVLTVRLPLREEAKPRQIKVDVAAVGAARSSGRVAFAAIPASALEPRITGSTDGQPGVIPQDGNPAVFVCGLDLCQPIDVQQIRSVDSHELARIQRALHLRHRLLLEKRPALGVDGDVVVLRFDVVDLRRAARCARSRRLGSARASSACRGA